MTSNVSATSTTGLYGISSNVSVPNNAQQLLNLLYSNGNVNFSLANSNTQVQANALVSGGSGTYGNANVAAFLPTYGGPINAGTIFNDSGFAIQGRDYSQMQFTNGVTPPTSEYDIGVGSWFYLDSGGGVFQSNTTGTLKTIILGNDATINAGGNVTAPYFIGDGSKLTNIPSSSGNVQLTGNVTGSGTTGSPINTFISASGVTAGTYGTDVLIPQITVGTDGRLTNVTTVAISGGGSYGNSNVAAYLASNTDPTISNLNANAAVQATQINTLNANVGAFELYANANIGTLYLGNISTNANIGAFQTYANVTFSTVANAASQQTQINTNTSGLATLNANVGAFETYANSTFLTTTTGVKQIVAGANITISPTSGLGVVTVTANTQAGTYTNSNVTNLLSGGTYGGDLNAPTGVLTAAAVNSTGAVSATTYVQAGQGLYSIGTFSGSYSDGLVADYTTGNGRISVGTADSLTFYSGGVGTTPTAVIYPNGNLVAVGSTTTANVITTNGVFWSNGTAYSSGGGTGPAGPAFSGNLAGNVLYDSVNNRTFANAFPLSTPDSTAASNQFSQNYVYTPTYTNSQLQQPPLANATTGGTTIVAQSGQIIGFAQSANVALQSGYGYGAQNRNTIGAQFTTTFVPVTANSMSNNDRVRGLVGVVEINPKTLTWGTMTSASQNSTTIAAVNGVANMIGSGNVAALVGGVYGSFITPAAATTSNIQYSTSLIAFQAMQATAGTTGKANIAYARMLSPSFSGFSANLTIQNAVGLHTYSGWAGTVGSTTAGALKAYAVLNEDSNTVIQTNGNITVTGNTNLGPYKETIAVLGNTTGTVNINYYSGSVQTMTLTGNITINTTNILNMPPGGSVTLIVTQDATGGRTLTSNLKYAGGLVAPTTTPSVTSVINIFYDGTNYLGTVVPNYI